MLDLSLETDQTGAVTVDLDHHSRPDLAAHLLTLRDVTTGATVDMWAVSAYSFAVDARLAAPAHRGLARPRPAAARL